MTTGSPAQAERLTRPSVPALDAVLGVAFPVLDDGFVRVVDYMGHDGSVVQAARVSYGDGTKRVHEDRGLIRYLLRHAHTTPFEMCEIKLHVRVPMDTLAAMDSPPHGQRQRVLDALLGRHRRRATHAARAVAPAVRATTGRAAPDSWTRRRARRSRLAKRHCRSWRGDIYDARLAAGVAREQARKDLPLSTYTEAYWKVDLHNLLHFLPLRMDDHAQEEIRAYAALIGDEIAARWVPMAWEAFIDYRRQALRLSRIEVEVVTALASGSRRQRARPPNPSAC